MDKAVPSRVTPPPARPGALKKPQESPSREKGSVRPVTPPKANSPVTPPATVKTTAATAGTGVVPTPTPKSPPPIGLSPCTSPTTPEGSMREKSESPGKSGDSKGSEEKREKSRSPLGRRPQGAKQRARFAKGNYGDQRVKFADPIDNRDRGGGAGKGDGSGKGKASGKGKGKSKNKGKTKGKQKSKGKDKGRQDRPNRSQGAGARPPGGGGGKRD